MKKKDSITKSIAEKWRNSDFSGKTELASVPRLLMLEVTNACNLKCAMCQNPNMMREKGVMPLELGLQAIKDAAKIGIKEVALFSTGEPLLYKNLEEMIVEAKIQGLYCYITSNGLLLDEAFAKMLCMKGLDSFKFSIDAATKEEYESVRINGSFDKLVENIRLLKNTRDQLGSQLKIICAAIVDESQNDKIKKFKKLFEPMCDSVLFSEMSNLGGKTETVNSSEVVERQETKPPCRLLWDRIVINYDGKITACCVDFDAELVYSDCDRQTLNEAWNNETIMRWRKYHLEGNTGLMPMCGECNAPYILDCERLKELNK